MELDKTQIARQFSRAATTYDDVSQLQIEMAERLIDRLKVYSLANSKTPANLVDLGCGTGWAMEQIAKLDPPIVLTGIDIAQGMIDVAAKRTPTASFICCDLEQTPIEDDSVDFVFSNAAIQWCEPDSAFDEIKRILRPDGRLIASTFGPSTLKEWREALVAIGSQPRVHEFETPESLSASLAKNGFSEIAIETDIRHFHFNCVDSMFQSIKKLGATNASTNRPAGMLGRELYRNLRAIFESQLAADGSLSLTFDCVFISAIA